jgi:hypothetical protein
MTVGDQDSGRVAVVMSIVSSHSHQSLELGFVHVLARASSAGLLHLLM